MKTSFFLALCVLATGACAHREPVQRSTVSTVGNEDVTDSKGDPDNKKMSYTKVSDEDALNHDRATREYEAAQGNLDRGAPTPPAAVHAAATRPEGCGHNVYFETASAELDARAKQQLDAVAACLKRTHSGDALVVGSADPRGSERENEELGRERAHKVAMYLKALGVPEREIHIRSQGESRASAEPNNWPMNRQAEIEGR
jgi:outer membrane protein OmpA-like peptidoglycan-associated protein